MDGLLVGHQTVLTGEKPGDNLCKRGVFETLGKNHPTLGSALHLGTGHPWYAAMCIGSSFLLGSGQGLVTRTPELPHKVGIDNPGKSETWWA